jgi:hypothetical protein
MRGAIGFATIRLWSNEFKTAVERLLKLCSGLRRRWILIAVEHLAMLRHQIQQEEGYVQSEEPVVGPPSLPQPRGDELERAALPRGIDTSTGPNVPRSRRDRWPWR